MSSGAGKAPRRAVLLVDHGSRRPDANALLEDLARALAGRTQGLVKTAHLETVEPDIGQGIDACVAEGARDIVVLPCFLAPGRHVIEDVPREATEAAARHPGVAVRVAEPLGTHPGIVEILLARLRELEPG